MRILGITIPENKRIDMALTAIYGIGRSRARKILTEAKVDFAATAKDINADDEARSEQLSKGSSSKLNSSEKCLETSSD